MLNNRLLSLIKTAMITKNQAEIRTLRLIKSEFTNYETAKNAQKLTEEAELKILKKMVKERKDSVQQYQDAGRVDLALLEQEEIDIIKRFLPSEIDEDILRAYIETLIIDKNPKLMGTYIKQVKEKFPSADGKLVADIVKSKLN